MADPVYRGPVGGPITPTSGPLVNDGWVEIGYTRADALAFAPTVEEQTRALRTVDAYCRFASGGSVTIDFTMTREHARRFRRIFTRDVRAGRSRMRALYRRRQLARRRRNRRG